MLANSEFIALLKQANTDSSNLAEVIGISEAQLRFVTNTSAGMGLIKCGRHLNHKFEFGEGGRSCLKHT